MKTQVLLLAVALALPLGAQEPGITRQQADDILNELRQIRRLLEKPGEPAPAPGRPSMKLDDSYMLGSRNAPITMVEFTDLQCPFCQRFHVATFKEIKEKYIDTGKVRFYSRDFPLSFHSNALGAAEAARCAGEQGEFWKMRDVLSANPGKLAPGDIKTYVENLKLDMAKFQACTSSGKYRDAIQKDFGVAQSLGVNGTPAFIVGRSTADGVEGELVVGALPFADFDEKLKALGK
jgi:protein-disulfide isomerase